MENSNQSTPQDKGNKNFFKKGFKTLKGMLSSNSKNQQQTAKQNQNLIFNELSRYVQAFINFDFPYDRAHEVLVHYCELYQIEQSRMHLLLTELKSNQKKTSAMFTDKEQLIWSLERRSNRLKAFGFSDKMQIIGMTIKYIDKDETLRNLLLLGKDYNDMLKHEVLKQSLLRASQDRLKQKRKQLWLDILQIDCNFIDVEYETYRQQSLSDLPKNVSDAIEVDVNRSFNHLKKISSENLNNILKTYAIVNRSLDYCQGMNFIAGYLYLIFEKESLAYAVMKELINKFKMSELFDQELPMLKLNFYQLDRLIAIILPDLHSHFKDEAITSSYYSAPYFITLFTSCLQMQTTGDHCEKLLRLWDYFIINGWKSVFKGSLLFLKEFEETLLSMPFEVMLTQIVNMPIKFYVHEYESEDEEREDIIKFDKQMKTLKIPNMLLERLKREFDENYKISMRSSTANESQQKNQSK